MARGRGLTVIALLVAVVAAFGAYAMIDRISLLTATQASGRSAVWVYTPHVAPGDPIAIEVVVKGGKRLGIEDVTVKAGERVLQVRGEGQTWGYSITSRRRDSGQDAVELAVQVPPDAHPGTTLPIEIDVSWIAAESDGTGRFHNQTGADQLRVDIPVRTSTMRTLRRLLSALWAFGLLAAACGALLLAWRVLGPTASRRDDGNGMVEALGLLMIIAMLAYGFVGYGWFALPLVAATGVLGGWFVVLAVIAWLVVPVYATVKLVRRAKRFTEVAVRAVELVGEAPYRAPAPTNRLPDRMAEPRPLADTVAALQAANLAIKPRRRGFDLRHEGEVLRVRIDDKARVTPGQMRMTATRAELVLDLAIALVPLYGPLAAHVGSVGEVLVDGVRDRAAIDAEVSERIRAIAQAILDRLKATQPLMDELAKKLGTR